MRGGSWAFRRDGARCAARYGSLPGNRNDKLGFRVVLRSSHVFQPLPLVPPRGGTVRRHIRAGRVPEMPADPRQRFCRPRRRKLVGWAELAKPNSPSGSARSRTCDLLGFVPQPNLRAGAVAFASVGKAADADRPAFPEHDRHGCTGAPSRRTAEPEEGAEERGRNATPPENRYGHSGCQGDSCCGRRSGRCLDDCSTSRPARPLQTA